MRISDWSSDVCSSDLHAGICGRLREHAQPFEIHIVVAENSVDGHTGLRAADEPSEENVPVQTTSLRNGLAVRRKGRSKIGCGHHRSRAVDAVAVDDQAGGDGQDRKSTRLNYSH